MIFNIDSAIKHSYSNDDTRFSINVIDEILEEYFDALLDEGSKILHSIEGTVLKEEIFSKFDKFIVMVSNENYDSESDTEEPPFEKITINTDYKIKKSLEEPSTDLKLKPLPENLEYVVLEEPSFLPVIISSQLSAPNKSKLVSVLKKHKESFAWKITDIPSICPSFYKHNIQLLDDKKPVVQKQSRLNPNMQEVVKKEMVKLLDTGIIYPITDSPYVSPIHCVPKKGGITIITNENDELVPTKTVTGWRVCIDYRKLNEATTKDHFPLPFLDQMLERLAGNKYFCFLDATFQRCMLAIFHDMIEESIEVFMDDFSVFGNSFDKCLNNLDKMLQHCKDAHLVLNYEKCHFMVKEGIVLGHKVSNAGLDVDKAKIDVISKIPPPTNIKGVRSFLGHASFYRRFIKDFSEIARPLTKLLEKDTRFEFNDECRKAFNLLKEKLTCAPVIVSPNWNLPFELMCDASDFAVAVVLELDIEIKDKKGTENVAADHLSQIKNNDSSDDSEVDDNFPGETLMEINTEDEPWFVDFANYFVGLIHQDSIDWRHPWDQTLRTLPKSRMTKQGNFTQRTPQAKKQSDQASKQVSKQASGSTNAPYDLVFPATGPSLGTTQPTATITSTEDLRRVAFTTPPQTVPGTNSTEPPPPPIRNKGPELGADNLTLEGVATELAPSDFVSQNYETLVALMQEETKKRSSQSLQSRLNFGPEDEVSPPRHRKERRREDNHRPPVFGRIGKQVSGTQTANLQN
ncbi:reverse transcriptase domain-containing protein, partial [Tanacetum coccineum]